MKYDAIIFDLSGTLAKMRPATLLIERSLLLSLSKRYKIGILTGGRKAEVLNILRKLCLDKVFLANRVMSKNDTGLRKPDPQLLSQMRLRLRSTRPIYVGDSKNDKVMASKAQIPYLKPDEFVRLKW